MSLNSKDINKSSHIITMTGNSSQARCDIGKLPSCVADHGKVRIGGQGPVFRAAKINDAGKVRLGGQGPLFR